MQELGCVLAIGNFDGVHLGHQKIIAETKALAKKLNLSNNWGVLYFVPHPTIFFNNNKRLLLTCDAQKKDIFHSKGIPKIIDLPFADIWQLSPEEFVSKVLIDKLNAKAIVTGKNFSFGKNKVGNADIMQQLLEANNIIYYCIDDYQSPDGGIYSSSRIRDLITHGQIKSARALLSRNFSVRGEVVHGNKIGRQLGFPTANVMIHNYTVIKYGVYVVNIYVDGTCYKGVANFGTRPTLHEEKPMEVLEANLFNYNYDLYDKIIEIEFLDFMRDELKFESMEILKHNIQLDVEQAQKYFIKNQ